MRFMTMVRSVESAGAPPKALIDAIEKLSQEGLKAGTLIDAGGLHPSRTGTRVRIAGGRLLVTDGPFAETKEVIGGYAVIEATSKAEAIEQTKRFMQLHVEHWPGWEGETEVRQLHDGSGADCGQVG